MIWQLAKKAGATLLAITAMARLLKERMGVNDDDMERRHRNYE